MSLTSRFTQAAHPLMRFATYKHTHPNQTRLVKTCLNDLICHLSPISYRQTREAGNLISRQDTDEGRGRKKRFWEISAKRVCSEQLTTRPSPNDGEGRRSRRKSLCPVGINELLPVWLQTLLIILVIIIGQSSVVGFRTWPPVYSCPIFHEHFFLCRAKEM